MRAELLEFGAWSEILLSFGRTTRAAVALTDSRGRLLGDCHNVQPVWKLIHASMQQGVAECPFCISKTQSCTAVLDALRTGVPAIVHDQAGLTHLAVPLSLGSVHLGAIIAGQVFDRYPEPLSLRRVAKDFEISAPELWDIARKERPISSAALLASGDLLSALGNAFLRQRFATILEVKLAEANRRFRLLVEGVRDHALFTMDPNGFVTSWNRGAERLLGYAEAEILGRNFSCFFTPEDVQGLLPETRLQVALQAGQAASEGWRVRRSLCPDLLRPFDANQMQPSNSERH